MPRFVIERALPEIGSADRDALRGAAQKSNGVLAEMRAEKKFIQWEHSYVAANKTFCIYDGPHPEAIRRAAERNGLPVDRITKVSVLDPYFYR